MDDKAELLKRYGAIELARDPEETEALARSEGREAPAFDPLQSYVWLVEEDSEAMVVALNRAQIRSFLWYGQRGGVRWGGAKTLQELFSMPGCPVAS